MTNDPNQPLHGPIPGSTPHARAVAVAGFLAEQGIQSLSLSSVEAGSAEPLPLAARATDLPGELCARASWVLSAAGVCIQGDGDRASWTTHDPSLAAALRASWPQV